MWSKYAHISPVPRVWLVAYKATLSVILYAFGVRCRHTPTCSEYAAEAWCKHGFFQGIKLGVDRLGRCRPGGTHGYDPVPETLTTPRTIGTSR